MSSVAFRSSRPSDLSRRILIVRKNSSTTTEGADEKAVAAVLEIVSVGKLELKTILSEEAAEKTPREEEEAKESTIAAAAREDEDEEEQKGPKKKLNLLLHPSLFCFSDDPTSITIGECIRAMLSNLEAGSSERTAADELLSVYDRIGGRNAKPTEEEEVNQGAVGTFGIVLRQDGTTTSSSFSFEIERRDEIDGNDTFVVVPADDAAPASPKAPLYFSSLDAQGVAELIKSKKNIVVMLGAGASCAAGIPDFRTAGTGLYDNLEKYDLPEPEALFTLDYLRVHPEKFYRVCNEMKLWPGSFAPTHVHHFLKVLYDDNRLCRVYTQNIDCLERHADLPGSCLVEAHGTFAAAHCIKCNKEHDVDRVKECVDKMEVPRCDNGDCGGIVKPDVVFFGEGLPKRFFQLLEKDMEEVDLLLVIGTSLQVTPFALIHTFVDKKCPRVLINRDKVGEFEKLPEVVDRDSRDLFLGGDCQAAVKDICQHLGLAEKLDAAYKAKAQAVASAKSKV